jgi:hypothetical protein
VRADVDGGMPEPAAFPARDQGTAGERCWRTVRRQPRSSARRPSCRPGCGSGRRSGGYPGAPLHSSRSIRTARSGMSPSSTPTRRCRTDRGRGSISRFGNFGLGCEPCNNRSPPYKHCHWPDNTVEPVRCRHSRTRTGSVRPGSTDWRTCKPFGGPDHLARRGRWFGRPRPRTSPPPGSSGLRSRPDRGRTRCRRPPGGSCTSRPAFCRSQGCARRHPDWCRSHRG